MPWWMTLFTSRLETRLSAQRRRPQARLWGGGEAAPPGSPATPAMAHQGYPATISTEKRPDVSLPKAEVLLS
jgi:hypothetical protein